MSIAEVADARAQALAALQGRAASERRDREAREPAQPVKPRPTVVLPPPKPGPFSARDGATSLSVTTGADGSLQVSLTLSLPPVEPADLADVLAAQREGTTAALRQEHAGLIRSHAQAQAEGVRLGQEFARVDAEQARVAAELDGLPAARQAIRDSLPPDAGAQLVLLRTKEENLTREADDLREQRDRLRKEIVELNVMEAELGVLLDEARAVIATATRGTLRKLVEKARDRALEGVPQALASALVGPLEAVRVAGGWNNRLTCLPEGAELENLLGIDAIIDGLAEELVGQAQPSEPAVEVEPVEIAVPVEDVSHKGNGKRRGRD